jgi:RNA polymerase sigma-70 factor (ECF subfamily)
VDRGTFEALYDRYGRVVFGVALRMLGEQAAAEDIVQAVFLTLWSRPDVYREGNIGAWLARVARNRCLDVLRIRKSRPEAEMPVELVAEGAVDEGIFARLDGDRVREALAALPDDQRIAIEMGFFGGITHAEIATRTGAPLGTIKTRIRAGLRRLRDHLERTSA